MATGWLGLLRSLGEAFVEVLSAEVAVLKRDLAASGRRLSLALGLAALALFLLFWAVAAGAFVLFEVLALWLPGWAASLIVFGLFLLAGLVTAIAARRRLSVLESPASTVRRRIHDHREWWQKQLLVEPVGESQRGIPSEEASLQGPASEQ